MYCKKCGKQLPDDAEFCTYCGAKVDKQEDPSGVDASKKKKPKKKKWKIVLAVIIGIVAFTAIMNQLQQNGVIPEPTETVTEETTEATTETTVPTETTEPTEEDLTAMGNYDSMAYVIAKDIVTGCLKAPSTADFCKMRDCKFQRYDSLFAVQGFVDAQNSFGAMIRSEWVVEFILVDKSSYGYTPVYVNIDGEETGEWMEFPEN